HEDEKERPVSVLAPGIGDAEQEEDEEGNHDEVAEPRYLGEGHVDDVEPLHAERRGGRRPHQEEIDCDDEEREGGNDEGTKPDSQVSRAPWVTPDLPGAGDQGMEDEDGDRHDGVEVHPEGDSGEGPEENPGAG